MHDQHDPAGSSDVEAPVELTLDPADWDAMKALGRRMVDDMLDHLRTVRERPVWQPVPEEVRHALRGAPPKEPLGADAVYRDFQAQVLPYATGNVHPRFWGWVMGTGTSMGVLAEMLAAGMNPNAFGGEQSSSYVEAQVIGWFRDIMGLPASAGGLLVSGCSQANLTCLTAARDATLGPAAREDGLAALDAAPTLYVSSEVHSSVDKAASLLGIGRRGVRIVPVTAEYRMDVDALRDAIAADLREGRRPFCIVASAGTVNTGAIDDLDAIADVAREHALWFHVDGAIGAVATMSPRLRPLFHGIERADSVAFDLHKWMYMPYGVACALVRDPAHLRASFSPVAASYLARGVRGLGPGEYDFGAMGMDLSRAFLALKVWMSVREQGLARYRALIEQNVAQIRYLVERAAATPNVHVAAPTPLNIACLRYQAPGMTDEQGDAATREILVQLHERGIAVPSGSIVGGRYVMRIANTNQRSQREDFDVLLRAIGEIGDAIAR